MSSSARTDFGSRMIRADRGPILSVRGSCFAMAARRKPTNAARLHIASTIDRSVSPPKRPSSMRPCNSPVSRRERSVAVSRSMRKKSGLVIWACAVLPDHVHLVTGRPHIDIEQVVIQLKGDATRRLMEEGIHPFGHIRDNKGRPPKCFARGEWKVFLDPPDVPRAIRYAEDNPDKEGKPRQQWSFVTPYYFKSKHTTCF